MQRTKRQQFIQHLNAYFRTLSKKLIHFDSETEALKTLANLYIEQQKCDLFLVCEQQRFKLIPRIHHGADETFLNNFPLMTNQCNDKLLQVSMMYTKNNPDSHCALEKLMQANGFKSWYTIIIRDERKNYGLCIVGFKKPIPLYEDLHDSITDFGEDLAIALKLAREKKQQQQRNYITDEWLTNPVAVNTSIAQIIEKMFMLTQKTIHAQNGAFYIYAEKEQKFYLQQPTLGNYQFPDTIDVVYGDAFEEYFPSFGQVGTHFLSVPLMVNLKLIGVLWIYDEQQLFTEETLQMLQLIAQQSAVSIDNISLYQNEKKVQQKLQQLLHLQQELVKETLQKEQLHSIVHIMSTYLNKPIMVCNRFLKPLAHTFSQEDSAYQTLLEKAIYIITQPATQSNWLSAYTKEELQHIRTYDIRDNDGHVGYLIIDQLHDIDEYIQLSVDICLNILSMQFMKQKIGFRAQEQVKDSIINKLFTEKTIDEESMITYANVFNWNLYAHHRIALLKIVRQDTSPETMIARETSKAMIEELIKSRLKMYNKQFIYSSYEGNIVLILNEQEDSTAFWHKFYQYIQKLVQKKDASIQLHLGIGGVTQGQLYHYSKHYAEAKQALHIAISKEQPYIYFDQLGAFTVLHSLENKEETSMYIEKQLSPLLEEKQKDLLDTLHTYLANNGNLKDTSEQLFIHRSTLQYRLEKIHQLLQVDLTDADTRFNLMLALKMHFLH